MVECFLLLDWSLVGVSIGLFIGLILALTGAGGSILAIPLLMLGLNLSFNQAAPIALLAVMIASIVGTIQGLRLNLMRYKTAWLIASFGIAFAPIGVWMASYTPNQVLRWIFAFVLFAVAWHMWRQTMIKAPENRDSQNVPCMQNEANSQLNWTAPCTRRLIATGTITGFISGLLGVGGGFVLVPSLQKVSNFSIPTIVATALFTVVLISIASIVSHSVAAPLQWNIAIPFALSTMFGLLVFSRFSQKLPAKISLRIFAVLAVLAALLTLLNP